MPLFKRRKAEMPTPAVNDGHAVLLHFKLSGDEHGTEEERAEVFAIEERLEQLVAASGAGEFDGNEFGGGEAVLYLYGPDKDALWRAIEPQVRACSLRPAYALLRAGGPDVEAEQLDL